MPESLHERFNAFKFKLCELQVRSFYSENFSVNALLTEYLAGVAGGIVVVLVGHPFDTTKTRLQTSPLGFYGGTIDCVKKTLRREGVGGFYSGAYS